MGERTCFGDASKALSHGATSACVRIRAPRLSLVGFWSLCMPYRTSFSKDLCPFLLSRAAPKGFHTLASQGLVRRLGRHVVPVGRPKNLRSAARRSLSSWFCVIASEGTSWLPVGTCTRSGQKFSHTLQHPWGAAHQRRRGRGLHTVWAGCRRCRCTHSTAGHQQGALT